MRLLCRKVNCTNKKCKTEQTACSGQVMMEYVVMLALALVLVLALSLLYTVTTDRGHRMIDSVSWNIP